MMKITTAFSMQVLWVISRPSRSLSVAEEAEAAIGSSWSILEAQKTLFSF